MNSPGPSEGRGRGIFDGSGDGRGDRPAEHSYIRRVLVSTIWFSSVAAIILWYRVGGRFALGYAIGTLWGILNFWFLKEVVVYTVTLEDRSFKEILWRAVIKFPILYGIGIWILVSGIFSILALTAGFSMVLVVFVLKALGSKLTGKGQPG